MGKEIFFLCGMTFQEELLLFPVDRRCFLRKPVRGRHIGRRAPRRRYPTRRRSSFTPASQIRSGIVARVREQFHAKNPSLDCHVTPGSTRRTCLERPKALTRRGDGVRGFREGPRDPIETRSGGGPLSCKEGWSKRKVRQVVRTREPDVRNSRVAGKVGATLRRGRRHGRTGEISALKEAIRALECGGVPVSGRRPIPESLWALAMELVMASSVRPRCCGSTTPSRSGAPSPLAETTNQLTTGIELIATITHPCECVIEVEGPRMHAHRMQRPCRAGIGWTEPNALGARRLISRSRHRCASWWRLSRSTAGRALTAWRSSREKLAADPFSATPAAGTAIKLLQTARGVSGWPRCFVEGALSAGTNRRGARTRRSCWRPANWKAEALECKARERLKT